MAKKTWKIGEYCKGGIIVSEVKRDKITLIGKEWDFSKGTKRGSNQSNAKEFTRLTVNGNSYNNYSKLHEFLNDLTSCYYADEIIKWIESKIS